MTTKYKYCPKGLAVNTAENNTILVSRTRCKMWSCPYCAEVNKKQWRARIMLEVERTRSAWYFWTITLDGKHHAKDNSTIAQQLAKSMLIWRDTWNALTQQIRRDLGKMRYVRIFEAHKDGTLHIHILMDKTYEDVKPVKQTNKDGTYKYVYRSKKFSAILKRLKLGRIHDIRPIVTEDTENNGIARNVSAYVTKYLTKDIQSGIREILKNKLFKRTRMIQTSQNWATLNVEIKHTWVRDLVRVERAIRQWQNDGDILDIQRQHIVEMSDYEYFDHYPNKDTDLSDMSEYID